MDSHPCETSFEPLLDAREAAKLLRVHHMTLLRLVRRGQFPAAKVGKLWGFRVSDLNAWITSGIAPRMRRSQ